MKVRYHLQHSAVQEQLRMSQKEKLNLDSNQTLSSTILFFSNPYIWTPSTGTIRWNDAQISMCFTKREQKACFSAPGYVCDSLRKAEGLFVLCGMRFATAQALLPSTCPPQSVLCCLSLKSNTESGGLGSLQYCSTSVAQSASGGRAFMPQGYTETQSEPRTMDS